MLGITPTPIERYDALENNERVRELIDMWDVILQVNSSHVLKPKLFSRNL